MSSAFPELQVLNVTVDSSTRERHLVAIHKALLGTPRPRKRRRLFAIALAAVLVVPVVALAAEQSLPGDFLYPLKRGVVEPVVSIFDDDVAATHRVREVEDMAAEDTPPEAIRDHILVARDAAVDSPDLLDRIDHVVADIDLREQATIDRPDDDTVEADPAPGSEERTTTTWPTSTDATARGEDPPQGDGRRDG